MSDATPVTIRIMTPTDLDFCVDNVTREGWLSETRATFEMFLGNDRGGCFVAEDNGTPIGICIATAYVTAGFLGELIVVPDRRGQSVGRQLMEHAIRYLQSSGCMSIYLDGDLPAIPLYERLGFRVLCDSLRFLGVVDAQPCVGMRPLTTPDLPMIYRLDREAFGADRSFLIRNKFARHPTLAHAVERGGDIVGYIMGEAGHGIVSVGPWVVCDSITSPIDSLCGLACHTDHTRLRIGVLKTNTEASKSLRAVDTLEETTPCRRMVLGPPDHLGRSNRLWALGSAASG